MVCICSNWARTRLTSWTCTPAPAAMRRLRLALRSSGFILSWGVMLSIMPWVRRTCLSATLISCLAAAWANCAGNLSIKLPRPPICLIWLICIRKSFKSKPPFFTLSASFWACSMSTLFCACSTSARISPMPKMRLAMRSASNGSKPSSFSATPANLIGTPVMCWTDKAAPPRASPSNFVRMTPVRGSVSLNAFAVLTASWPNMASTTNNVSTGLSKWCSDWISCIIASSMPNRPAVSTINTSW